MADAVNRQALVDVLNKAKAALSSHDIVPILSHFCFDGTSVTTFNDRIGIRVPCNAPLEGALHGERLLALLAASSAKDVTFTEVLAKDKKTTAVKVKLGSGTFEMPLLPPEAFVFEFPDTKDAWELELDEEALDAISFCLLSASQGLGRPELDGVTLDTGAKETDVYSTDNVSICHVSLPRLPVGKKPVKLQLSKTFCEALTEALKAKPDAQHADEDKEDTVKEVTLYVGPSYVVCHLDQFSLYGSLPVAVKGGIDQRAMLESLIDEKEVSKAVELPAELEGVLQRALIMAQTGVYPVADLQVQKGQLSAQLRGWGTSSESIPIGKHPDVLVSSNLHLLVRALPKMERLLIKPEVIVMARGNCRHYVTVGS